MKTTTSLRELPFCVDRKSQPRMGILRKMGIPLLESSFCVFTRPPSTMVSLFCTAIEALNSRESTVGHICPSISWPALNCSTFCSISMTTSFLSLMCGLTFSLIPTLRRSTSGS